MGQGVLAALDALGAPAGPRPRAGLVRGVRLRAGIGCAVAIALVSLVPLALRAQRAGALGAGLAAAHAALFLLLFWRHPVPALWVFRFRT